MMRMPGRPGRRVPRPVHDLRKMRRRQDRSRVRGRKSGPLHLPWASVINTHPGTAQIDGLDVFWQPVEVRRRIGYMPENCPLYSEMRVNEYLHFRGGIKGLHGRRRRERIEYVLRRCWLSDVRRQLIGTLSKGYRQRVGLADALLADPPVLILDEPTAGLDPSQIRASRELIRQLGKERTILLSTHILPEVEM